MNMDYTKLTEKQMAELIEQEALKDGITEPDEQLRHVAKKNKALAEAFVSSIMRAERLPEAHI